MPARFTAEGSREYCSQPHESRCDSILTFPKKRTAGLRVGTAVGEPTVQVARPLLGDRRWVSGEEIVSASVSEAKLVPLKNQDECWLGASNFFLFLRRRISGSLD